MKVCESGPGLEDLTQDDGDVDVEHEEGEGAEDGAQAVGRDSMTQMIQTHLLIKHRLQQLYAAVHTFQPVTEDFKTLRNQKNN